MRPDRKSLGPKEREIWRKEYGLLMFSLLNLLCGFGLLFLGGQYLLQMFRLIDTAPPRLIGWFVDDLFHMGMSVKSSQAVVWMMTILGTSLIITNMDYIHTRYKSHATLSNTQVTRP